MPCSDRLARIFIDGVEQDSTEVRHTISVEFDRSPAYPEIVCKHVDDMFHRCESLGRRRVLIDSYVLKAIVTEVIASREVLRINAPTKFLDQADKERINKVTSATDTALYLGGT